MLSVLAAHFVAAALAPFLVRWWGRNAFLALALVPAATTLWALLCAPGVVAGDPVGVNVAWAPEYRMSLAFRMDVLGLVMTLIAAGIGTLILVYCARYFSDDEPGLGRFAGVLTAFAGAMLGLVLADDLVQLFIFWELTTVFSYLLIGHNTERRESRRAAMTALTVTTLGGLTMLVGLIMLGEAAGTYLLSEIIAAPPRGAAVTVALVLILVGALSKSALLPFSLWLPAAMQAPTPVSGYLHAAAMVKAGVYLVARLTPAYGDTPAWQVLTVGVGVATMILAGWKALRQYDLKLLLAYGTVSQLGFLTALLGAGTRDAALAGIAMLCAHALFKAPLFLVVGIIDHSTGTRDLRELSGLRRSMPAVWWISVLAVASMAGLPPLFGFAAKESAFAAFEHGPAWQTLALVGMVVGTVFTVGYSLRFLWGAFLDKPEVPTTPVHAPGALFVAPAAVLAALSLLGGPFASALDPILAGYADTVPWGGAHPAHLALWHGFGTPLVLTAVCLAGGLLLFSRRGEVVWLGNRLALPDPNRIYRRVLAAVDTLAIQVTGITQRGSLPVYLGTTLVVLVVLSGVPILTGRLWEIEAPPVRLWDSPIQFVPAAVTVIAAVGVLFVRRRLFAVVLVGVTGYGAATLFMFQGAPDLALTQFLVETVSLVVFVLVLRRLPTRFTTPVLRGRRRINLLIGAATGTLVAVMAYFALAGRRAETISSGYPAAAEEAGGKNIISTILVDLRAWDTMGEISVLAVAAAGVASLMFVRRRARPVRGRMGVPVTPLPAISAVEPAGAPAEPNAVPWRPSGIAVAPRQLRIRPKWNPLWLPGAAALARERRSVIFEVTARGLFPVIVLLSVYLLLTGHTSIGGGFAGGIVAGLGLMVRYLAGGRYELYAAVHAQPGVLIGLGLVIAAGTALGGAVFGTEILDGGVFDLHIPVIGHLHVTTSLLFDFGVYLLVIGLILDILRSLGARIDEQLEREARDSAEAEEVTA
ncbi:multisubunit sodium/proton antiporter, MrpA subunit (TC 2.A.63.1)/multisubunit sodium/proton antiporter, MrpB subunit (TC 2.A.63.1) [Marinactinospora thermotolerans DSM 45154]|uniref:Multisubunit sodium/proton antiporter, MrpA subunit (TC 2.A.63.1)/multisubunit sodium/proton antiporter, MrpB subunit (TC 2.A.63.1) n=1 Tax=Marinactinospora thermotolerans DSM 45154 TaxID=1122192 RepID=A0A1T4TFB4_9ACTN|nr:multisubunit sodium/proton antiporter, MrpA subunit (TC 2.A.63.1)/multisubunit sodium/proton antiporter, MrpB subunit (TC 2.A.63.1) [Marinactinospora thermotolerans DSM 45154]